MLTPDSVDLAKLYRRSPLQVALLTFATLGLYIFFWSFFVLRDVQILLADDENEAPLWYTLGLIVPLVNFFLIFRLFDRIKVLALRAQLYDVPNALGALGLAWVACMFLGRLPNPYFAIAMLCFIPLAFAQFFVARAEMVLTGFSIAPASLNAFEIIIILLGILFRGFVLLGETIDDSLSGLRPGWWFAWLTLAVSIGAFFFIARNWDRAMQRTVLEAPAV